VLLSFAQFERELIGECANVMTMTMPRTAILDGTATPDLTVAALAAAHEGIYTVIEATTPHLPQGKLTVERMCALAGVS
jgi:hypothetical protein